MPRHPTAGASSRARKSATSSAQMGKCLIVSARGARYVRHAAKQLSACLLRLLQDEAPWTLKFIGPQPVKGTDGLQYRNISCKQARDAGFKLTGAPSQPHAVTATLQKRLVGNARCHWMSFLVVGNARCHWSPCVACYCVATLSPYNTVTLSPCNPITLRP